MQALDHSLKNIPVAICLTETLLQNFQDSKVFTIESYKSIENCYRTKRGGWVGMTIRDDQKYSIMGKVTNNNMQVSTIALKTQQCRLSLMFVLITPTSMNKITLEKLPIHLESLMLTP